MPNDYDDIVSCPKCRGKEEEEICDLCEGIGHIHRTVANHWAGDNEG